MAGLFELETYTLGRKVLKLVGAAFYVHDASQRLVAYCNQKAFRLKEDIRIHTDESQAHELLAIRARQIVDFGAAYDVIDGESGKKVGSARRKGVRSILRDSWELCDPDERVIARLEESSTSRALLSRFLGALFPQSSFLTGAAGPRIAVLRQRFNPFFYELQVQIVERGAIDPRLVFAAAVLIAAIEGRQG